MATEWLTVDVQTLRSRAAHEGRPEVCGFFSLDGLRRYRGDLSQFRYLRLPGDDELARGLVNLDVGTDAALARDDARVDGDLLQLKLGNLLQWLRDPRVDKDPRLESEWKPEIVTNRKTLRSLMRTPFDKRPDWTITAQYFDGVVYLHGTNQEPAWANSEENRKLSMWGHKFEEYVTTNQFRGEKVIAEDPTVLDPKFYAVFVYEMRKHRVLYMAEIDAVESVDKLENLKDLQKSDTRFVEFKTNRFITNSHQRKCMKSQKFPKWWEQCHLTNIDKVVCGFRDEKGVVRKLETFTGDDILNFKKVQGSTQVSLNFMEEVLDYIKDTLEKDRDPPVGNLWQFESKKWIRSEKIGVRARRHGDEGDVLLPRWFTCPEEGTKGTKRTSEGPDPAHGEIKKKRL